MGKTNNNAVKIYQITYIFGVTLGSILYYTINKIWPPAGLGIEEDFDGSLTIDGIAEESGSGSVTPSKAEMRTETTKDDKGKAGL